MKGIEILQDETRTARFEALYLELQEDWSEDLGDMELVAGHLAAWYTRLILEPTYRAGILLDVSQAELGSWSSFIDPLSFGRALIRAGYVKPLAAVYPPRLLMNAEGEPRTGYVVLDVNGRPIVDAIWAGLRQSDPELARDVCLFLGDPETRWRACAGWGISISSLELDNRVPSHWKDEYMAWLEAAYHKLYGRYTAAAA